MKIAIEILEDIEAKKHDNLDLVMVKIEGENSMHHEYGFVDKLEAIVWINSINVFEYVN